MTEISSFSSDGYSTCSDRSLPQVLIKEKINSESPSPKYSPEKERQEINSIIAIGEPIVDITSYIEPSLVEKYGLKIGDSIFADETSTDRNLEVFKELESMATVNYVPGGSVQNTTRVLSWCLRMENKKNIFTVSMLGSIGDDGYKNRILNALEDIGVNPLLQIIQGDKTSRCGVGIYQKEKCFVTQLRASKRLSEDYIKENMDKIMNHQAIIIEGYLLKSKFDICENLCENFSKAKKLVVLTLSATFIIQCFNSNLMQIANKADIIAGNMAEAKELSGNKGETPKEIFTNCFKKFRPKENRLLIITDGPNGAFCAKYDYKEDKLEFLIQQFANNIKDEDIQDFNGAGDAFLGGFLSEYMKGNSILDCLRNGVDAATVILRNVGCTFPKKLNLLY